LKENQQLLRVPMVRVDLEGLLGAGVGLLEVTHAVRHQSFTIEKTNLLKSVQIVKYVQ
jgi:hypothetical protein